MPREGAGQDHGKVDAYMKRGHDLSEDYHIYDRVSQTAFDTSPDNQSLLFRRDISPTSRENLERKIQAQTKIESSKKIRDRMEYFNPMDKHEKRAQPPGHLNPSDLEPGRIVVYKKTIQLHKKYYVCEISYNKRGYFISLFSVEYQNQSMTLHLKNCEKTDKLINSYNGDFNKMAHSLILNDGRIILMRFQQKPSNYEVSNKFSPRQTKILKNLQNHSALDTRKNSYKDALKKQFNLDLIHSIDQYDRPQASALSY